MQKGESYSTGRIYDRIGETVMATVKLVLPKGMLCKVKRLAPILSAGE